MNTKIRLLQLGMKQIDLVKLVNDKGVSCSAVQLNLAINERSEQKKYQEIMKAVDEILTEIEGEKDE